MDQMHDPFYEALLVFAFSIVGEYMRESTMK